MNSFLDESELKFLTSRSSKAAQCKALKEHWNIPFDLSPNGTPVVLRSVLERCMKSRQLLNKATLTSSGLSIAEPDFSRM